MVIFILFFLQKKQHMSNHILCFTLFPLNISISSWKPTECGRGLCIRHKKYVCSKFFKLIINTPYTDIYLWKENDDENEFHEGLQGNMNQQNISNVDQANHPNPLCSGIGTFTQGK